jgi:hypothetical protein
MQHILANLKANQLLYITTLTWQIGFELIDYQNKMYKENEHQNLPFHLFLVLVVYIKYKTLCQL